MIIAIILLIFLISLIFLIISNAKNMNKHSVIRENDFIYACDLFLKINKIEIRNGYSCNSALLNCEILNNHPLNNIIIIEKNKKIIIESGDSQIEINIFHSKIITKLGKMVIIKIDNNLF